MINLEIYKNKSIIAIDYGRKFTGIASYKVGNDPYPLMWGRVPYQDDEKLIHDLKTIIKDEFADVLIVGVPYFTDGTESTLTKEIKAFIKYANSQIDVPVLEQDETLTTFEAEERMKSSPQFNFKVDLKQIDALSAVVILELFLKCSPDNL